MAAIDISPLTGDGLIWDICPDARIPASHNGYEMRPPESKSDADFVRHCWAPGWPNRRELEQANIQYEP
jgi:hypothetical protein